MQAGQDSGDDGTRDTTPDGVDATPGGVGRPLSATALADSRPTTGRGVGALVVLGLAVLLPVSWLVDLLALVQRDFGDPYGPRHEGPVLAAFVVGAALGVGVPVLVLVVQARVRRRDPSLSAASLVGAAVVLVLAVPTHGLALAGQVVAVVEEHRTTSAPPTPAERTSEGRDAGWLVDARGAPLVPEGADVLIEPVHLVP